MAKIMSIAASSSDQIKMSFTPQFIGIKSTGGTVSAVISKVIVTREGSDTIINLDGTGYQTLSRTNTFDSTENAHCLIVPMADGWVNGPATIQVITTAAGSCEVFAFSLNRGNTLVRSLIDTIVANQETRYEKFYRVCVSGMSANDIINYEMKDGTAQLMSFDEVIALGSWTFNNDDDIVEFNNSGQTFNSVRVQPVAQRTAYVQKFVI
jgi:hypothetical protein